jgi:molybdenum cofactor synthesis domain-containing protein
VKQEGSSAVRATVIVVSDRSARGERADATGPRLKDFLAQQKIEVVRLTVVPDERDRIVDELLRACAESDVVFTAGGTGLAPRDVTVEATRAVIEREVPGIGEAMRAASAAKIRTAMLSRATAGVRGRALIVNLPGSPAGACECAAVVLPVVPHAVQLLQGEVKDCADARGA